MAQESVNHDARFWIASKKQRHVTRSTFAGELFGCCDTIDTMLVVILALQEVETGMVTIEQARRLREYGPYHYATIMCVDAMLFFSVIITQYVKARQNDL